MDLDNLFRTYLHLNDPKYQGITYKFAGAFLVVALAVGISFWSGTVRDESGADPAAAAASERGDAGSCDRIGERDGRPYLGYTKDPGDGYDIACLEAAKLRWQQANPTATATPELSGTPPRVIGYWLG